MAIALGCSSTSGPAADAAVVEGGDGDDSLDGPADEVGDVTPMGAPLPAGVAPPLRLLADDGQLVTYDDRACTNQDPIPAAGDRWCAFTKQGPSPGVFDLWVVNVTAAAATGTVPACDGSDANCLRLSRALAPTAGAFFDGDTLIYYADQVPGVPGDFLGTVYGWRPGWSVGRTLTSARGILCFGHAHAAVAGCLDDPVGDPANRDAVTIRVGSLADPSDQPLPALGGQWAFRNDNLSPSQAGFSPDGQTLAFSNVDVMGGAVSLKTVATASAAGATPQPALTDLVRWTLSNDGQAIYFFRGQPDNPSLYVADFPSGANPQLLATSITSFALIGDRATDLATGLFQQPPNMPGSFLLLRDRTGAPPASILMYTDALEGLRVSLDLRFTLWLDGAFRARLAKNDTLETCALNAADAPAIFSPFMTTGANLLVWTQAAADADHRRDGYVAPSADCTARQRFAQAMDFALAVGDSGLIFGDESDPIAQTVTLKYVAINAAGDGLRPGGPYRIADHVRTPISRAGTGPQLLLYRTVQTPDRPAGTFLFGVPF
ncbi:MAG TPA: hypothetical protein VGL59_07570 [Polyangia bacterium]